MSSIGSWTSLVACAAVEDHQNIVLERTRMGARVQKFILFKEKNVLDHSFGTTRNARGTRGTCLLLGWLAGAPVGDPTRFSLICTVGRCFPAASNASTDARRTGLDSNSLIKYTGNERTHYKRTNALLQSTVRYDHFSCHSQRYLILSIWCAVGKAGRKIKNSSTWH
jgi:hypothetical protein